MVKIPCSSRLFRNSEFDKIVISVPQIRLPTVFEPRHEKACLLGFRPGKTQTGLPSYRSLKFWI